ncbi:hypothetical protein EV421DRAFT_1734781 [Armillaria borealis]|uniref:Uncharacterized protein n=1 Tax=Armillaria borealis TaxID=47425 RepID=A0AA39MSJ9_9AGAR|nr:hypothetical protein EV421DRAFT_1734781 [Armillaria borealis]
MPSSAAKTSGLLAGWRYAVLNERSVNVTLWTILGFHKVSHDNFSITGAGQYLVAAVAQCDISTVVIEMDALKHVQHRNKWHMATRIGGEQESGKEDSGIKQAELTQDWDARTSMQVFRQQRGLAMYWERGTEPDIYALGQGSGSIKSKIQAVMRSRHILEAVRKVLSKKKNAMQYEDRESFTCRAGADADTAGSTVAERDD